MGFKRDLVVNQYAKFDKTFTYKINNAPVDLTGYSAASKIKDADGVVLASFTVTITPLTGKITLSLTASETSALTKSGFYDILLKPSGGDPVRFGEGSVILSKGQTQNVA